MSSWFILVICTAKQQSSEAKQTERAREERAPMRGKNIRVHP